MAKVTYLFGAGASRNALPIVKDIPSRLNDFYNFIQSNRSSKQGNYGGATHPQIEEEFMVDCQNLIEKVKDHDSIDTYAKKLRIIGDAETYRKVKSLISTFFIWEQLTKPIDKRYDSFFASILKTGRREFPDNVRIVSWNYDFQFEMAYSNYSGNPKIFDNQVLLRMNAPGLDPSDPKEIDKFAIYKVNGSTAFYDVSRDSAFHLHDHFDSSDKKLLSERIIESYGFSIHVPQRVQSLLYFAWESNTDGKIKNHILKTLTAIDNSDVLVVIGYSFPFFNRDVDKQLISAMASNGNIQKIYIQDPHAKKLVDKIPSVFPVDWKTKGFPEIIPIKDTTNFYLPAEL